MPKKRFRGHNVVFEKEFSSHREALVFAEDLKAQYGGWTEVTPQALDRCPGDPKTGYTMDHSHARYDGVKWCDCCKAEL